MTQALNLFIRIWQRIIYNFFDGFDIGGGVTPGWIVLVVATMALVLRSILPLAEGRTADRYSNILSKANERKEKK